MKPDKPKKNPLDYLPWAGLGIDPELEPELFALLPGRVQRERLFMRKMLAEGRQFTVEDMKRAGAGDEVETIDVSLPQALTLSSLRSRLDGAPPAGSMMRELEAAVSQDALFAFCTEGGEGRRLINRQPVHGFYAYLWALTLVHRKLVTTLALPYFWELEEGLEKITGKRLNTRTKAAGPLLDYLNRRAQHLASCVA